MALHGAATNYDQLLLLLTRRWQHINGNPGRLVAIAPRLQTCSLHELERDLLAPSSGIELDEMFALFPPSA